MSVVARNRQLREVPARRPVRPIRCRNEATVAGASIWMTRSRSPTSMPSSSVDVATITQSRASANAGSAWRRSSALSEECDTNVVTPASAQRGGELLDPRAAVAEHQPLLAAVQRGDDACGVRVRWRPSRPCSSSRPAPPSRRRCTTSRSPRAAADEPVEQLSRGCRRWPTGRCAGSRRPASASSRSSTASRCQPRSSPAKAWISSTTTARTPPKQSLRRRPGATSASPRATPAWSAAGRAGRRRIRRRSAVADVAVPQRGTVARAARSSRSRRGWRLFSSARSGQT